MKWKNGVKPFADSNNQLHYIAACKYQPTPTPFYSLLFFSLAPNSPSSIHSLYFLSPHLLPHFRQILDWNRRSNANATPPRSLLEGTQTVTAISLFFALLASEAAMSVSLRSVRFFLLWLCKLRSNRARLCGEICCFSICSRNARRSESILLLEFVVRARSDARF